MHTQLVCKKIIVLTITTSKNNVIMYVLAKYPSDGRVSAIRQPTPLPPSCSVACSLYRDESVSRFKID